LRWVSTKEADEQLGVEDEQERRSYIEAKPTWPCGRELLAWEKADEEVTDRSHER